MNKTLPVYELQIDGEESFVDAIALVQNPAIEVEFLAFSKHEELKFSIDEERMELMGAVMIPDQLIYRRNDDGFEYNVFFSKETIRNIAKTFAKKGFHNNIHLEHTEESADSYVYQMMISDHAKGINLMDTPDGTLVIVMQVQNQTTWEAIKAKKHKGFSIEGVFEMIKTKFNKPKSEDEELLELLEQLEKKLTSTYLKK
jgi:hypothetical protein